MPLPQLRVRLVLPFALVAGLAACVIGCGGDGVNSYNAPKSTESGKGGPEPEPAAGEYRILGGIFPADDPAWFFKFPGPSDQLTKYDADFDKLLASVSLPPNGGPPEFTPPEGWVRGKGRGDIVAATIKTPDGKYEVSISSSRGGVAGNLSRWADQLGSPFAPGDVAKVTKPVDAKSVKGLRVDMRGPKKPPMGGGGPMMGGK